MAVPTDSVLVSTIGVSIVPSSSTCVDPASFPKAFPTKTAPGHLLAEQIAAVRKDGRDAGADRVALHDSDVTDRDASHVGDRVQGAGRSRAWCQLELARPRPRLAVGHGGEDDHEQPCDFRFSHPFLPVVPPLRTSVFWP